MLELPDPGLYRTTEPMPGNEQAFPADVLVYLGKPNNGGVKFVTRPGRNDNNRWFWGDPTTPLRSPSWANTLLPLRSEGFYTLPERIELEGGGYWLRTRSSNSAITSAAGRSSSWPSGKKTASRTS